MQSNNNNLHQQQQLPQQQNSSYLTTSSLSEDDDHDPQLVQIQASYRGNTNSSSSNGNNRDAMAHLRNGHTLIFSGAIDPERHRNTTTTTRGTTTSGNTQSAASNPFGQNQNQSSNGGGSIFSTDIMASSSNRKALTRNNNNTNNRNQGPKRGGIVHLQDGIVGGVGGGSANWTNNDWSHNLTSLNQSGGNNKKMEILQMNLPEDLRISKLLRRLSNEKNVNVAQDLCRKLQFTVADPANVPYIRRCFEGLADAITSLLRDGIPECADVLATIFGQIGFAVRGVNFLAYKVWIIKCYKIESLRIRMIRALQKTLELDMAAGKGELRDFAPGLMDMLKVYLEDAEMVPLFIAITETIRQFSLSYPREFEPHFTDIVDIVIGWHLETDQTVALKQHCGSILQGFDRFWAMDTGFTVNLLGQFLEDIVSCGEEILANLSSLENMTHRRSPVLDGNAPPEQCFAALVGAFTSVIKCSPQSIPHHIGWNLLTDSFQKITKVAEAAIAQSDDPELLVNINEFIIIVVEFHPVDVELPYDYIRLQLAQLAEYTEKQILSTLIVILKLLDETQADDIGNFIEDLFRTESTLPTLRFSKSVKVRKAVIRIYTQVLNIKNVSVLQTVYNNILVDLGKALHVMDIIDPSKWSVSIDTIHSKSNYSVQQAEATVIFYLTTLSVLATSTSSIIAMWALQPSIIELLTQELKSDSFSIWRNYPAVHFSIITLLTAHCKKNNNFIASSVLLNAASTRISEGFNKLSFDSSSESPTTQHFAIILRFLANLLENLLVNSTANIQILHTILEWTHTLLTQISAYADILQNDASFTTIAMELCRHSTIIQNQRILVRTTRCLEALQQFPILNETVLTRLSEICCIHMCSTNESFRHRYSTIFSKLPVGVSLRQVSEMSGVAKEHALRVNHLLHWFASCVGTPAMRPKTFLRLVEVMQINQSTSKTFGPSAFEVSWPSATTGYSAPGDFSSISDDASEFSRCATSDLRCLIAWAQMSAAQLCVDTKLRTPLGKPIDTFVGFERLIKGFARSFVLGDTTFNNTDVLLSNQHNVRVLLGFMEALEKQIYNAREGAAFALQPPERPSRLFFGVNASTCKEYFNRNRMTVNLLAMHSMDPNIIIRNCEISLRELVENGKSADEDFDFNLINLVHALLRNGESDALHGLYIWCQQSAGRKFVWIQCAADQAAGRRETALRGYREFLATNEGKSIQQPVREFIADQVIVCLDLMNDYQQMSECVRVVETNQQIMSNRMHIPLVSKSSAQLDATWSYLSQVNTTDPITNRTLMDLSDWNVLNVDGDGKVKNIATDMMSYQKIISVVENTLIASIVGGQDKIDSAKLRICKQITSKSLQECLRTGSHEHLHNLTILSHMCHKMAANQVTADSMASLKVDASVGSASLSRLLGWCNLLVTRDRAEPSSNLYNISTVHDMQLDIVSLARKETNYEMCQRMLDRYFMEVVNLPWAIIETNFVHSYDRTDVNDTFNSSVIVNDTAAKMLYEGAKCLRQCQPSDYACQYAATLVVGISIRLADGGSGMGQNALRAIGARTLLTLSEWMQGESDQLLTKDLKLPLTRLVSSLPDVRPNNTFSTGNNEISIIDAAAGKLIQFAVNQCPQLSKSWGALGNWCFRWGRKMVEIRVKNGDNRIGQNFIEAIRQLLPNANEDVITKVVGILNRHQVSADDEEIAVSDSATCSTEAIEAQLRTIETLADIDVNQIYSLLDIWRQAQRNVYAYYRMSAEFYFKYLHLTSDDDGGENPEDNTNGGPTGCSKVTVTLRLLRLIVKHALGLQDVLEEGLAETPTSPWKVIIPQLFSRLNHHEPYVRKRVSELLCRLAVDSPNLIIFPAVVGSNQEQKMDLADISMVSADDELDDDIKNDANDSTLTSGFNSLLHILSDQAPETVSQVQCLVRELKRVTLLWDELWLVGLAQTHSDLSKRLFKFDMDVRRAKPDTVSEDAPEHSNLSERYRLMLRPLIFVIERLQLMTCIKAETNNERSFQRHFTRVIDDTLAALRQPYHPSHYTENISKFKTFYSLLQSRSRARAHQPMKMLDISPVLAQMTNTVISMPGVTTTSHESPIYIKSVNNSVRMLPTKTKPKKLAFHGSDGRRYTYLFKGLEDLHLDERIMQFLSIANSMMNKSSSARSSNAIRYRARNYSVIPLGSRSGLISWVDGVMPIFALYKKWMMRDNFQAAKKDNKTQQQQQKAGGEAPLAQQHAKGVIEAAPAARLCDTYLKKLVPRLAEHKCKVTDNRKDWPLVATRKVLDELIAETPRDLLSKELWCNSVNSAAWRQCVRNFSHSVAVMSVIGYVIGLGDRHLDNILLDINSGEVVHIDYNVCFEKGKTLRVPEKVPFRMTQNIEDALGVTGVEGTFRITCENVLATLKNGRETLLTLLEAFVYDPLIDWAIEDDGGAGALAVAAYGGEALGGELRQAHKLLEHEVNRDTLALRFNEIRPDWMRNSDDVRELLTHMEQLLRQLQTQRQEKLTLEKRRDLMFKQLAMVGEVQQFGSAMQCHPINTVSQRYAVLKRARAEHERIEHLLQANAHNDREHMKRYVDCVREATKANASAELQLAINQVNCALNISEFEIVRQLLESSDQQAMYVQGDQIRKELDTSYVQQATILKQCIEAIIQYSEVASLHATSQGNGSHRHIKYAEWCEALIKFPSATVCYDVNEQYKAEFSEITTQPRIDHAVHIAYQLIAAVNEDKNKVHKLCERLQTEMETPDPIKNLDEIVMGYMQDRNRDCLAVNTLCVLNQRLLMLEGAAEASGDILIDMTTANGKWFLDEMCAMTGISLRLCEMMNSVMAPDATNNKPIHALRMAHTAYSGLRQFHRAFIKSILPHAMVEIFAENPSVLAMISAVCKIAQELPTFESILANLHLHLRCSIMGMNSPHEATLKDVHLLKSRLSDLKYNFMQTEETTGSKLFTDFWMLFAALDQNHERLTAAIDELDIPNEWQRIDQIKEARKLAAFTFNPTTRPILEDISTVARFCAVFKTFRMLTEQSALIKGTVNDSDSDGAKHVCDSDMLVRPVRQYIADYVRHHQLGVVTTSVAIFVCNRLQMLDMNIADEIDRADFGAHQKTALDELCRSIVDKALSTGTITIQTLNRDTQIYGQFDVSRRRAESIEQLLEAVQSQQELCQLTQRVFSAHMWLKEELLVNEKGLLEQSPVNRAALVNQLVNANKTLMAWRTTITKMRSETDNFVTAINQRLKWAVGANPQLNDVLCTFTSTVNMKQAHYDQADHLANVIIANCSAILNFERLRIAGENTHEADRQFFGLVTSWEKSCLMVRSGSEMVSPVEEALVELLDPEGPVDHAWLSSVSEIVNEMCQQQHEHILANERAIVGTEDLLHDYSQQLRNRMSDHHRIASEVKSLLRKLLKVNGAHVTSVREYLSVHKEFLETVTELHGHVLSKDFTEDVVVVTLQQLATVLGNLHRVFGGLFSFEVELRPTEHPGSNSQESRQDPMNTPSKKLPKGAKTKEKCNAYAMSVWRRIRMKLEGRDPDPTRRFTVAEQVDWMIREARNPDNLAVLYEGWAAWV